MIASSQPMGIRSSISQRNSKSNTKLGGHDSYSVSLKGIHLHLLLTLLYLMWRVSIEFFNTGWSLLFVMPGI